MNRRKLKLIESTLKNILFEIDFSKEYPEMEKYAIDLADEISHRINKEAKNITMIINRPGMYQGQEHPYKTQAALERLIEILQSRV